METELQKLKAVRSFKIRSDSFNIRGNSFKLRSDSFKLRSVSMINRDKDLEIIEDHGYTSLKDIILSPPPRHISSCEGSIAFDSSTISIKNELVKHAASAYVQSAILVNRNQSCLADLLAKIKDNVSCQAWWYICFKKPLKGCFRVMFQFLDYVASGVGRVWSGRCMIT